MKVKVQTLDGFKAGADIDLNDDVFGVDARADILHRVVRLAAREALSRAPRPRRPCRTPAKSPAPARSSVARRAAAPRVTATARRRSSFLAAALKAHGPRARTFGHSLEQEDPHPRPEDGAFSDKAKGGKLVVLDTLELQGCQDQGARRQARQAGAWLAARSLHRRRRRA
nr:hypothetical protein [Paracoccus sp. (in: a-proteobacteria)]